MAMMEGALKMGRANIHRIKQIHMWVLLNGRRLSKHLSPRLHLYPQIRHLIPATVTLQKPRSSQTMARTLCRDPKWRPLTWLPSRSITSSGDTGSVQSCAIERWGTLTRTLITIAKAEMLPAPMPGSLPLPVPRERKRDLARNAPLALVAGTNLNAMAEGEGAGKVAQGGAATDDQSLEVVALVGGTMATGTLREVVAPPTVMTAGATEVASDVAVGAKEVNPRPPPRSMSVLRLTPLWIASSLLRGPRSSRSLTVRGMRAPIPLSRVRL
mmetsp:Transcript_5102/g.14677  ORF Transcript_5102/g.14677 Transcript_5102/m.14677 type:complete len:270 (-) Transcript_5102:2697-3506(-)